MDDEINDLHVKILGGLDHKIDHCSVVVLDLINIEHEGVLDESHDPTQQPLLNIHERDLFHRFNTKIIIVGIQTESTKFGWRLT